MPSNQRKLEVQIGTTSWFEFRFRDRHPPFIWLRGPRSGSLGISHAAAGTTSTNALWHSPGPLCLLYSIWCTMALCPHRDTRKFSWSANSESDRPSAGSGWLRVAGFSLRLLAGVASWLGVLWPGFRFLAGFLPVFNDLTFAGLASSACLASSLMFVTFRKPGRFFSYCASVASS